MLPLGISGIPSVNKPAELDMSGPENGKFTYTYCDCHHTISALQEQVRLRLLRKDTV